MISVQFAETRMNRFIESLTYEEIPDSVKDSSKKLLLDLIGVMCLSYEAESTKPIFKSIRKLAGNGEATIIGSSFKLPPQYAAILNGTLAHSSEFDDTNALGHSHPGAVIIPSVLAVVEDRGNVTGKELITSIVVGYEIMCRVGAALGKTVHLKGFHVTPISGIFGAVAAISKLYKLDEETIHKAMGLAGSLVSGSHQFSENGAWNKRLHPGLMAHNAFLSVHLAVDGILGATFPFTGSRGFLKGYTDDPLPEKLDHELGTFWYTDKTAIKPFPSCRLTHSAIDLIMDFYRKKGFSKKDIEELDHIHIEISPRAYLATGERTERRLNPENSVDAQFSIYFQVAAALLRGEINTASYQLIGDERISAITKKISVKQNETFLKHETRIKIVIKSEEYQLHLKIPKGEPENPIIWDEVINKFKHISTRLGESKQRDLIKIVEELDKQENLKSFFKLLSIEEDENYEVYKRS